MLLEAAPTAGRWAYHACLYGTESLCRCVVDQPSVVAYLRQMIHATERSSSIFKPRRTAVDAQPRQVRFGPAPMRHGVTGFVAAVALLALVASWLFGTIASGLFVAATMGLIAITPRAVAGDILKFSPLLLLPILAVASTIWSDSPERTFRAALQLMITCLAGIVVCRRLGATSVILMLFFGMLGTVVLMLPGVPESYASHMPLGSSLLGSKNQVGFAAYLLIALALAVAVDKRQPSLVRLSTIPAFVLGLLVLVLSQSAGSTTSLLITLITFPTFVIFGRIPMQMRILALLLSLVLVSLAVFFMSDLQAAWNDFRLNVLKKDATLTGRTYLWDFAARLNAERPWLGRGYYAFWRQGNIDAEGLWRWGGIAGRSGFNFHNAFIEMQVDLGWIGQGLFIATCGAIAIIGLAKQLVRPTVPMAFLLSLLVVIYIRSYAESGLIAPFSLMTLLWIGTAIYGLEAPSSNGEAAYRRAAPREARRALREHRRL